MKAFLVKVVALTCAAWFVLGIGMAAVQTPSAPVPVPAIEPVAAPQTPAPPVAPVPPPATAQPRRAGQPSRASAPPPPAPETRRAGTAATEFEQEVEQGRRIPPRLYRNDDFRLRVAQDYTLGPAETVRNNVVVVYGNVTIHGHVEGDLTVVLGSAQLSETAVVEGSLVVVGGRVTAAQGAVVGRDLVIVGGPLNAPMGFAPWGEHVVVGSPFLSDSVQGVLPWVTRGLLLGRPMVPSLSWVWTVAGVFFLVYFLINLVFGGSVRAAADTLAAKPLSTFLVGLLVLLLTGPVVALLAVSIVGIAVIPFFLCALFVGGLLGKVSVIRRIGMSVVAEDPEDGRLASIRSFVIGFVIVLLVYMVPVLGFVAWATLGLLGLGAACLTFITAFRLEHPRRVRPPRVVAASPPEPPQPPPPAYQAPAYEAPYQAPYQTSSVPLVAPDVPRVEAPGPSAAGTPGASRVEAITRELVSFPHAAFQVRLAAFLLDVVLVLLAFTMLGPDHGPNPVFLRFVMVLVAYHVGFWTWKGTTIGGIICNLRVIRLDGTPLRFIDALVRGLSGVFSLAVVGLGGLWILQDQERQAWHDKIAGTYVVQVPRNWPVP